MRKVDRDALKRAIEMVKTLGLPEIERAVAMMLATSDWREAAEYACFHVQSKLLRLRPWQAPPCASDDVIDPAGGYGASEPEVALRRRLIALGLSPYEPDVLDAIEGVERAQAKAEAPQPAA